MFKELTILFVLYTISWGLVPEAKVKALRINKTITNYKRDSSVPRLCKIIWNCKQLWQKQTVLSERQKTVIYFFIHIAPYKPAPEQHFTTIASIPSAGNQNKRDKHHWYCYSLNKPPTDKIILQNYGNEFCLRRHQHQQFLCQLLQGQFQLRDSSGSPPSRTSPTKKIFLGNWNCLRRSKLVAGIFPSSTLILTLWTNYVGIWI